MADQLDELHARTGIDLLVADATLQVFDDEVVPAGTVRYVRVYTHIERPFDHQGNRLTGTSDTIVTRWYVQCVGENDTSARALGMRVRAAMLDVRPIIAGRDCGKIRQEATQPPRRDESTGALVIALMQVYRLTTTA